MEPLHVIVAIDANGNEALYVGGDLVEVEGNTVFAVDIAKAVGTKVIQFSHVSVELEWHNQWPSTFGPLLTSGSKSTT